jgi:hypothetical protein
LHLNGLLTFDRGRLVSEKCPLEKNAALRAVWAEWTGEEEPFLGTPNNGNLPAPPSSLRELLQSRQLSSVQITRTFEALRKIGIDPKLPPRMLHRLIIASSAWGFDDRTAGRLARAIKARDMTALKSLIDHNEKFLTKTRRDLLIIAKTLSKPARMPGRSISRTETSGTSDE